MPEIDNIKFNEVVAMIEAFNNDHGCNMLQSKYKQQSLFEINKTVRKERVHSAFLAWLFKENFENIPLNGLLYILYTNHSKQLRTGSHQSRVSYSSNIFKNQHKIIEHIRNQAIIQNTTYSISDVETEYPILSISNKKGKKSNQYIDILLKCTSPKEEPLMILIENKIYATETQIEIDNEYISNIKSIGGNPSTTKAGKIQCGQTLAYYNHFSKRHPNANVLYVFLDPTSSLEMELATDMPKCECKGFIHITYQDLMDRILIPLRDNKNINTRIKSIISDYIACLGATLLEIEDNKSKESLKAMALDKETRELLQDFWAEHETLIMAALDSLTDDINTEESTRKQIKEAIAALRSYNRDKYQFTYKSHTYDNNRKGYKKGELLYEIIKILDPKPISSIIVQFKKILDHNNKSGVISTTEYDTLVKESPSYKSNRFIPFPNTTPQVYISKQWGINEIPQVIAWAATQGIDVTTI